jgi:phosphomannomutase
MPLPARILREYDIRGTVGQDLTEADAHALGLGFGTAVIRRGGKTVAVGRDGRVSSPALEKALVDGLLKTGVDVRRIGLGPTPMLYFATLTLPADGGIMVTGSHNPPDQNGFKMMLLGQPFYGADIQDLGRAAVEQDYVSGTGTATDVDIRMTYIERVARDYGPGRGLSVAWDPGNGAAGAVMDDLAARLPGRHIIINGEVDGTFPAHHPDPTDPHTLEQLIEVVKTQKLDLGIAFDGDADRIGVVDSEGRILWGDQLMSLYSAEILRRQPGATIIADCKASQVLFDEIARLGGKPLMWRTGHSLIKVKMAETGSPLAGEMSGHIFFKDGYYGFDDALYAAVRLLAILSTETRSLATLRDGLPATINTPELRFPCVASRKFAVVEEVKDRLTRQGADFNPVDGVRVLSADGWWLLRASNTQEVLVARCESDTEAGLERLKTALIQQVRASGIEPPASI